MELGVSDISWTCRGRRADFPSDHLPREQGLTAQLRMSSDHAMGPTQMLLRLSQAYSDQSTNGLDSKTKTAISALGCLILQNYTRRGNDAKSPWTVQCGTFSNLH